MIKHNLLAATQSCIGASLSFNELAMQATKLQKYTEQTGKGALSYFNLINGNEASLDEATAQTSKLSLFMPYSSQYIPKKHMQLQGFNASHTEYLVNNRHKQTQNDYISLLKQLGTDIGVTPIEQMTITCGRKKISRTNKNSVKAYNDLKAADGLDSLLLFPAMFESADDNLVRMEQDMREPLDGVMLFDGQSSMSLGAQFDSARTLREARGDQFVIGMHENATPIQIAVMSLAGIDFFQTDYPLELALEGKTLRLVSDASQFSDLMSQAQLMEKCQITGPVSTTILGIALAGE